MKALLSVLPIALLGACDGFADGLRAFEEGRHRDALVAFTAAEQAAGHDAPAALLYDRALAALQAGELRVAELSAEKAAARGGARFTDLRDFLLGNVEWLRTVRAEAEAAMQDADPTAFSRAIAHARQARDHWQAAAASRADWPAARRNAERALRKLEDLERRQQEAEREREAQRAGRAERQPAPDPQATPPDRPAEQVEQQPVAQQGEPAADELARLLARLAQIDEDKRALRRASRGARDRTVERDW